MAVIRGFLRHYSSEGATSRIVGTQSPTPTAWLGMSVDRFLGRRATAFGSASPLTQISSILRDDPDLNQDAAAALDEMIKATYARLRSKKTEK
jgi:hypothetical protein